MTHRLALPAYLPAALAAAASFAVDSGWAAAALTGPWLLVTAGLAIGALPSLWPLRGGIWPRLIPVASLAYLAGAAFWLAVSRLGARPLDLSDAIVELTGVHFLFAGFGGTCIGACVVSAGERNGSWLRIGAALGVPAGSALVAAGFAVLPVLQLAGAALLAGSLLALAWFMLTASRMPGLTGSSRVFLTVAALSVVVGMALALQWAVGQRFDTPALSIESMVRTHGLLNGFGFTLGGLLGWRLAGVQGWERSA